MSACPRCGGWARFVLDCEIARLTEERDAARREPEKLRGEVSIIQRRFQRYRREEQRWTTALNVRIERLKHNAKSEADYVDSLQAALAKAESALEELDDFRAEFAIEACTAPDASLNAMLDSLRSRLRHLWMGGGLEITYPESTESTP